MQRILRAKRASDQVPDAPELAPLTHLLEAAEPDPDLLSRIETRIDAPPRPPVERMQILRLWPFAGLLLVIAMLSAFAGHLLAPDRQTIAARPGSTAEWVPLGTVTLHGPALRAFVRSKCQGYTHFYITMHGVSAADPVPIATPGTPLARAGEKILMECIF
ncbi:MAG: hypothetical protein AAGA94_13820 [Pseudomonadota bacterium]